MDKDNNWLYDEIIHPIDYTKNEDDYSEYLQDTENAMNQKEAKEAEEMQKKEKEKEEKEEKEKEMQKEKEKEMQKEEEKEKEKETKEKEEKKEDIPNKSKLQIYLEKHPSSMKRKFEEQNEKEIKLKDMIKPKPPKHIVVRKVEKLDDSVYKPKPYNPNYKPNVYKKKPYHPNPHHEPHKPKDPIRRIGFFKKQPRLVVIHTEDSAIESLVIPFLKIRYDVVDVTACYAEASKIILNGKVHEKFAKFIEEQTLAFFDNTFTLSQLEKKFRNCNSSNLMILCGLSTSNLRDLKKDYKVEELMFGYRGSVRPCCDHFIEVEKVLSKDNETSIRAYLR
jgi:chemotaxis protein histidine kinase CheA